VERLQAKNSRICAVCQVFIIPAGIIFNFRQKIFLYDQ